MAELKNGGQLGSLKQEKIITSIRVGVEDKNIHLWINESSLSYLSIQEAIELRDEINKSLKKAIGV